MTIRHRIAGQFSLIVATILIVFSVMIYIVSATYRQEEFYERLKWKARTTVRFLVEVKEIDNNLLKIIDRNTLSALINEKVLVFDSQNRLIYSSVDDKVINYRASLLDEVRQHGELEIHDGDDELVGVYYTDQGKSLVVLASAYDQFGRSKLQNLRQTLIWGLLGGIGLTVSLGLFFAGQSLQPIGRINRQVQTITSTNLRQRLDEGNRQDEIDQLAVNFNKVLGQLERAFKQQRSFVSHASHELRTPLTALKSEIQLGLRRRLSPDEHEAILTNLTGDTDRLISLSNSLLVLARSLDDADLTAMLPLRIEELLLEAQQELLRAYPTYTVQIDYATIPELETDTMVLGNESLLKQVFLNLMDNACKYSTDQTVRVQIATDSQHCRIAFIDHGIGINADELTAILEPFHRASNALSYKGFGLGLSICQRIIDIHSGQLLVDSTYGVGSVFTVVLAHQLATDQPATEPRS
ncbi:sensor histidine kinase [Fibrella aquatica]|jgi:signal transduction histidine kinase|uniref:sensor histidine kinase n=1 Tax=Fibrella aquatica TaxID=3242487 RepID=UPI0035218EEA